VSESDELIKEGDEVLVSFPGEIVADFKGILRRKPRGIGDTWVIENEKTVLEIQHFEGIWKKK